jgi:hypothetical protein
MKAFKIALCVAIAAICSSCGSVGQVATALNDLQQVQSAVSKSVGAENVTVNLTNGEYLTIALVNTSLKDLPSDQKKAKALEVATVGYRSYPQMNSLTEVRIVFMVQRSYFGVFNYTDGTDAFSFSKSELAPKENTAP